WRVLSFAVALALACGIAVGLAPALGGMRAALAASLGAGQRASVSVTHGRLRGVLIVTQVALTFVLLTSAGLLLRSVSKMRDADPGFDGRNIAAVQLTSSGGHFPNPTQMRIVMRQVIARVRGLPGVVDAAFVDTLPMQGAPAGTFVQRADRPIVERAQR